MTPEAWDQTTLGALCATGGGEIQTGPFGSQLHARDYVRHGVPVVMPQDIIGGRIDTSAIAQVREEDAVRLSKYRLRANDVVYSRRGDVRKCALVTPEQEGWLCGTGCLRVRVGNGAYGPFVGAYLTSQHTQDWVENNAVGLTMLNLNTSILGRVPVVLPPEAEQREIASVLNAIRAGVALAQTKAEETARLIGAVRRALLDEDEARVLLGEVTVWTRWKLGECFEIGSGTSPTRSDGPFVIYGANGPIGNTDRTNFDKGYTVGRVGAVGEVHRVDHPVWASDNTLVVAPHEDVCDFDFAEHLLRHADLPGLSRRSVQPLITQTQLHGVEVLLPVLPQQRRIAEVLRHGQEMIDATNQLSQRRVFMDSALREDLVSGRVRV